MNPTAKYNLRKIKTAGADPAFTGFQNNCCINCRRPDILLQVPVRLFEKHYFDLTPNVKFSGAHQRVQRNEVERW